MASTHGGPSRPLDVYLSRTVAELYNFLSPSGPRAKTIRAGQVVHLMTPDNLEVAKVTAVKAFHNERLYPQTNSPHAMGLHFYIGQSPVGKLGLRNIAITGDTQCPHLEKRKDGLREFTEQDRDAFAREYDSGPCGGAAEDSLRGDRQIDVLAMHIGSVEPDLVTLPERDALKSLHENVFYPDYHLGFAGCLRLLDMVFRNDQAGRLAILTEFGEELRGYRVNLARALQTATKANPDQSANVRVLPADIGMALELTWDEPHDESAGTSKEGAKLRCNRCLRMKEARSSSKDKFDPMDRSFFHPVGEIDVFEDLDTGLIQYCCHS